MNKLEIICYIVSAYFFGIATGCFVSVGVHNHTYWRRKKRRPREWVLGTDKALADMLMDPERGEPLRKALTEEESSQ